jgi:hypothetical protein
MRLHDGWLLRQVSRWTAWQMKVGLWLWKLLHGRRVFL